MAEPERLVLDQDSSRRRRRKFEAARRAADRPLPDRAAWRAQSLAWIAHLHDLKGRLAAAPLPHCDTVGAQCDQHLAEAHALMSRIDAMSDAEIAAYWAEVARMYDEITESCEV